MFEVAHLNVGIHNKTLLQDVSFELCAGDWMMVIGPNGAGKSTLISALSCAIPYEGRISLHGVCIKRLSSRQRALSIGILAQKHQIHYSFCVEEIALLGRYAHTPHIFSKNKNKDESVVTEVLKLTGLWEKRHQSVLTLSGGELQRLFLAQTFAQEPDILLLDEPTNHLDLQYQKQLFELISQWMKGGNRAVLSVVHDLSLARCYGNLAMLLQHGQVMKIGLKDEVFEETLLNAVYQMDVATWMKHLYEPWTKEYPLHSDRYPIP